MLAATHGRAHRIRKDAHDLGVLLLEVTRHARVRAAGASTCNKVVHIAAQVAPDLGTGGLVVRLRVRGVLELTERDGVGNLAEKFLRLGSRTKHAVLTRGVHNACTQGAHERLLLLGELFGHHKDHVVAASDCRKGNAQPHVAGGTLNDGGSRLEQALLLCRAHHVEARTVLHRPGGVPQLQLGKDVDALGRAHAVELEQRRVSNELLGRVIVVTHG